MNKRSKAFKSGLYQRSMGIWWSPTNPFGVLGTGAMLSFLTRANVPVPPALAVNHSTEGVGVWAEHLGASSGGNFGRHGDNGAAAMAACRRRS